MPKLNSVRITTVGELFSSSENFRLPWFQRAYSWQTRQVARLIGDLLEAMQAPGDDDDFFLGTLMLTAVPGQPGYAVVDGHQRLLTLTILFAVLRDLEPDGPLRMRLDQYITGSAADPRVYRLTPQSNVSAFFEEHVQRAGATAVEPEADIEDRLSDSERRILEVRDYVKSCLDSGRAAAAMRTQLAEYLAGQCRVVLHVFDDEAEAWRILNLEQSTRLEFDLAAEAKATILAVVPPEDRAVASRKWEASEHLIGPQALGDLLFHIRTLKSRKRMDNPVHNDICALFSLDRGASEFIEGWLEPYALHYAVLQSAVAGRGPLPEDVGTSIAQLCWIDDSLWRPPALRWLETRGLSHADEPQFFRRLDRLVWMLRLAGLDPPLQRSRMIAVANDIDNVQAPDVMRSLDIEPQLRSEAVENLRAQNFCKKGHAPAVLRRLSRLLGSDPGPMDKNLVTIEHVLPRNPLKNRQWWEHFPTKKAVNEHMHRLGNLTFLTHADNQLAETKDWPEKQQILAGSDFTLARHAAEVPDWNRQAIVDRTEDLIGRLLADWELAA